MSASNALTTQETNWGVMEKVVVGGDLKALSSEERMHYYRQVCESVGLNPLTRPFDYITLQGKLTLYARKDATEQLRRMHNVSLEIARAETVGDAYVVTVVARLPGGRTDSDMGAVVTKGMIGDNLVNAMLKAVTKAKRRVTLSICGLGMLEETETETIAGAKVVRVDEHGEIIEEEPRQIRAASTPIERPERLAPLSAPRVKGTVGEQRAAGSEHVLLHSATLPTVAAETQGGTNRETLNRRLWGKAIAFYGAREDDPKVRRALAHQNLHDWAKVSFPEAVDAEGQPSIAALSDEQVAEMIAVLDKADDEPATDSGE